MKFLHCGKPSKRSGMSGKSGAGSAEKTIRTFSKVGYFAKSAEKSCFVIGKVMAFNDERVKIRFTFENTLKSYETG